MTISTGNASTNSVLIDNIQIGAAATATATATATASAAPEPGSLALLLPVMGAIGMMIRKRRRK